MVTVVGFASQECDVTVTMANGTVIVLQHGKKSVFLDVPSAISHLMQIRRGGAKVPNYIMNRLHSYAAKIRREQM